MNSLLFILSIAVVEPRKRRRIVENVTNEILTLHEVKTKELLVSNVTNPLLKRWT